MVRNVVINEKMYNLNMKNAVHGKTTGTCYRLNVEEEDMMVKIYYQEKGHYIDHLSENELELFKKINKETVPILLSKYPVLDEDGTYIGEVMSFIKETKGKTQGVLYQLPKQEFLEQLQKIQEKIPVFDKYHINLYDLGIHNMIIGKGSKLPVGIYMIDDSFYMISSKDTELHNQLAFNRLLRSIIRFHFKQRGGIVGEDDYLEDFMDDIINPEMFYCTLPNLEKNMKDYPNLGTYLDDYFQTQKKKGKIY